MVEFSDCILALKKTTEKFKRHFKLIARDGTSNLMLSDLRVCELLNALWFGT